jgi:hypothetical protein
VSCFQKSRRHSEEGASKDAQTPDIALTEDTQGALPEDTQGTLPEDPQGALTEDTQGALPEDPQGALPEDTQGALPEDTQGALPEEDDDMPQLTMWQKIKCVSVSICSHLYFNMVYYFVFNIRSNVRWFSNVVAKLPTCVNGTAFDSRNPKED